MKNDTNKATAIAVATYSRTFRHIIFLSNFVARLRISSVDVLIPSNVWHCQSSFMFGLGDSLLIFSSRMETASENAFDPVNFGRYVAGRKSGNFLQSKPRPSLRGR